MLIAKQKRKENIAEYILYLYQIEDLIRAFQLDIDLIESQLVSKYQVDDKTLAEIAAWYKNLVVMMQKEGIAEKGHLQFLSNHIRELNEFHLKLLETGTNEMYVKVFQAVAGLLTELKTKNRQADNDMQLCFDAIYGYLLLKMKNSEITNETTEAVKRLSNWLGSLSKLFQEFEAGDLEF